MTGHFKQTLLRLAKTSEVTQQGSYQMSHGLLMLKQLLTTSV